MSSINSIISRVINDFIISEVNDVYHQNKLTDDNCPFLNKEFGNGFRISDMIKQNTAMGRIDYASQYLQCLGQGKRRTVFKLNDKLILKLTNGNHRYQTKNEYDTELLMSEKFKLFPKIYYQSKDFTWTISEFVQPLDSSTAEQILGMPLEAHGDFTEPSLEGFQAWAETMARRRYQDPYTANRRQPNDECAKVYKNLLKSNEWFKALYNLEIHQKHDKNYGTDLFDGCSFRPENLGVVDRGGKPWIVILDSGFIMPFRLGKHIESDELNKRFD